MGEKMSRSGYQGWICWAALWTLGATGCSTLGLSLYPSGAALTTEAKDVLEASRVPIGMARENAKTVLPSHALQPGDALLIEPMNLDRDLHLPADQIVLADGTVDLGPYGRVVVAGRNLEQAEALVEQQIVLQRRAQAEHGAAVQGDAPSGVRPRPSADVADEPSVAINVRLLEPVHRFYVLGEVNAPGSYPLNGSETVLDAIVGAGGLTASANPCQILLARPTDPCDCRVTLPICYREIVQMGNTATNYQLQPGDRVFVSTRSFMDELMFWRANHSCSRCSDGNRACCHPEYVSAKPIAMVANPMIPPGSVGADHSSTGAGEFAPQVGDRPHQVPVDASLGDYLDGNESETRPGGTQVPPDVARVPSDVDGELEFSSPPR